MIKTWKIAVFDRLSCEPQQHTTTNNKTQQTSNKHKTTQQTSNKQQNTTNKQQTQNTQHNTTSNKHKTTKHTTQQQAANTKQKKNLDFVLNVLCVICVLSFCFVFYLCVVLNWLIDWMWASERILSHSQQSTPYNNKHNIQHNNTTTQQHNKQRRTDPSQSFFLPSNQQYPTQQSPISIKQSINRSANSLVYSLTRSIDWTQVRRIIIVSQHSTSTNNLLGNIFSFYFLSFPCCMRESDRGDVLLISIIVKDNHKHKHKHSPTIKKLSSINSNSNSITIPTTSLLQHLQSLP